MDINDLFSEFMQGEEFTNAFNEPLEGNLDWGKVQWGVYQFSTDSIIFRGTKKECQLYIDDRPELWDDAEVYFMTPDDPHYIKDNDQELEESIGSDKFYKNAFKQLLKLSMNLRTGPLGMDRTYYDEYGFQLESQISTFSVEFDPDSSEWTVYRGSRKKRGKGWESLIETITDLSFTTWFGALTEEDINYLKSLNPTNSKESIKSIDQQQELKENMENKVGGREVAKQQAIKEMAGLDFEVGHTFDPDDFDYFKKVCKEDGLNVTEDDFAKYFEYLDEIRSNNNNQNEDFTLYLILTDYSVEQYGYYNANDFYDYLDELKKKTDDELFDDEILAYVGMNSDEEVIEYYISNKADADKVRNIIDNGFETENLNEGYSREGYSWDEINGMIHIYEDGKLIDKYPDMESAEEAGWDLGILTEGLGLMKCDNCGSVYNSIPFGAYGMVKCFVCGGRTFNFLRDDKGMVGSSYNFKDSKEKDIPADKVAESLNSRWKKMFGEPYKDSMSKATPQQLDDLKKRLLDTEKDKDEKQASKEIAHESYSMQENTLTEDSAAVEDQKKKFAEYQEKLNEVNKKIEELLDKKRKYDSATPEEKKQMDMIGYMDGIESSMSDYEQKQKHYMKEMEILDKQIKNNGENENPKVEDPKETGYGLAIFQNGKYIQGKVYKNSDEVNAVVNKVYKTKTGSGSLILVGIRPDKTLGTTIELKLGSHPSFNEIKKIQLPNDIKSQMNQIAKDLGFGGLKESLDQTREKALKMKESSNAFAILYGYRTKDGKEVELEPEEFATEEEYKDRIQQITNSFTKLSDKGPRGNRYGHEHNIEFYTIYPNKNSNMNESTAVDTLKAKYPTLDNTWSMGADKTKLNSEEFELLYALADKLAFTSPNQYKYEVKETYEDYGAGMKWYNIICTDKKGNSWQVLNTKEWLDLMNTGDVDKVYQDVINGDYFQDKQKDIKDMNMGELFNHMGD